MCMEGLSSSDDFVTTMLICIHDAMDFKYAIYIYIYIYVYIYICALFYSAAFH